MRAVGDSRRPLLYLLVCCVMNIILDIVMVVGMKMGIAGAALATVISQCVSAILVTWSLTRAYDAMKLKFRELRMDARVLKKWQIIIDATERDEGYQKKNDYYLSRCYNRGESNECTKYHRSVLEAKLYLGHNLLCSIATETIQNSEEYISQSEAKVKQDCESKAFIRLAEKIKKRFPRSSGDHNGRWVVRDTESVTDMSE